MAQDDDNNLANNLSTISSRAPFLPPCTPAQANQALQNPPAGLGYGLLGRANSAIPGLGAALHGLPSPWLAGDLAASGITSLPDCDPRLVNVTTDPGTPSFQTAQGTIIKMNKPGPLTTLPWGQGLGRLVKFADGTGLNTVEISGGTEPSQIGQTVLHSPDSLHGPNLAIDVSGTNKLDDETVRRAALDAGYTHGMYEVRPDGSKHWHLQVGPDNIVNAPAYDLAKGPMKTKVYPQKSTQPPQAGSGEN